MVMVTKTSQDGIFLCQVKQPVTRKSVETATESPSLLELPTKRHRCHTEVCYPISTRPIPFLVEGLPLGAGHLPSHPTPSRKALGLVVMCGLFRTFNSLFFSCTWKAPWQSGHHGGCGRQNLAGLMEAGREARLLAVATAAVPGGGGCCGFCSSLECLCHQQPELAIPGPADPWAGAPVGGLSRGQAELTWGSLWRVSELCGDPTGSKTS